MFFDATLFYGMIYPAVIVAGLVGVLWIHFRADKIGNVEVGGYIVSPATLKKVVSVFLVASVIFLAFNIDRDLMPKNKLTVAPITIENNTDFEIVPNKEIPFSEKARLLLEQNEYERQKSLENFEKLAP